MAKRAPRCLRCGEHEAAKGSWQCAACATAFAEWDARDWRASIELLDEQARWLAKSADRLDGAGFWAVAKAAWAAQEAVERLAQAIDQQPPPRAPD